MMLELGFAFVAALAVVSAMLCVSSAQLLRAVLWLGATLVATAALYAMLDASFLAGVQLLLYVGGVMTLLLFGLMITRRHEGVAPPAPDSASPVRALFIAGSLFGLLAAAILKTDGLEAKVAPPPLRLAALGRALLVDHVMSFEVVSLLLLAAIIGAVVIARRRDPQADPERTP